MKEDVFQCELVEDDHEGSPGPQETSPQTHKSISRKKQTVIQTKNNSFKQTKEVYGALNLLGILKEEHRWKQGAVFCRPSGTKTYNQGESSVSTKRDCLEAGNKTRSSCQGSQTQIIPWHPAPNLFFRSDSWLGNSRPRAPRQRWSWPPGRPTQVSQWAWQQASHRICSRPLHPLT